MKFFFSFSTFLLAGFTMMAQQAPELGHSGSKTTIRSRTDTILALNAFQSQPLPNAKEIAQDKNATAWDVHAGPTGIVAYKRFARGANARHFPFREAAAKDTASMTAGQVTMHPVSDGFLVGINYAEGKGDVYWLSKDRSQKYLVSGSGFVQFTRLQNTYYAIEGNSKGDSPKGYLVQFIKVLGKWQAKPVAQFNDTPLAIATDDYADFIVVTKSGLLKTTHLGQIETIYNGFWKYLSPSSLVVKADTVYMGMRQGVFSYSLVTKQAAWMTRH